MKKQRGVKSETRWKLEFANGDRVGFRTKGLAVVCGKAILAEGLSVRLIEEYDLFATENVLGGPLQHIDHREFDRSALLNPKTVITQ